MSMTDDLPENVVSLIGSASFAQYATVSAAGSPIDTPVIFFPSDDLNIINLTTGLSYPAKAERARRNPKVGLLIAGGPDEPIISIAGMAAVRDSDLQKNVDRYLAESSHTLPHDPDWSLARQAVWYWTRIIVEIKPKRIFWWDSPADMEGSPHRWDAPENAIFPESDPAPHGKTSRPAKWEEKLWRDLAEQALGRNVSGYLSVIDKEGFPLPMRLRSIAIADSGFLIEMPAGVPWAIEGKACLTFGGIETFLGEASVKDGQVLMRVDRTLPVFPMTRDMTQLWEPSEDTRRQLMRRLEQELQRRGQPVPTVPDVRPEPSEAYRRRMEYRNVHTS